LASAGRRDECPGRTGHPSYPHACACRRDGRLLDAATLRRQYKGRGHPD